jgi:uncharacterized protein (DUF1800 family)
VHLAGKLCRRFLADEPREAAVAAVAAAFTRSGGQIASTLRALFDLPDFLDGGTARPKLKRPFHYLASALRATDAMTDAAAPLLAYLSAMGHYPFAYPTPDGYPQEARPWRDTLLWRFKLAADLAAGRVAGTSVDAARLLARAGSARGLAAHLFGRGPTAAEEEALLALRDPGDSLALGLAAPAFQVY